MRGAERGPLVYCLETADLPDGATIEEIELGPMAAPTPVPRSDLGDSVIALRLAAHRRRLPDGPWPYREERAGPAGAAIDVDAIPYYGWANRSPGAMRVWIPQTLDET